MSSVVLVLVLFALFVLQGDLLSTNEWCHYKKATFDQEKVILKVVNTTAISKRIDWDIHLWYNEVCKTCDVETGEYHKSIYLTGNEEINGGCSIYSDFDLCVFVQFTDINYTGNKQVLTKFYLANFLVLDQ